MSVPSDVWCVQEVTKDLLPAFASAAGNDGPLVKPNVSHAEQKADLEKSLAVLAEKLADAEHRIQGFEQNNDTMDDLTIKADEAETKLKSCKDQIHSSEDKVSEQSNQLVKKNASSSGYRGHFAVLHKK